MADARLERGQRAPDFVLPRTDDVATRFYAVAGGRPTALAFAAEEQVAGLRSALGGDAAVQVVGVVLAPGADDDGATATFVDGAGQLHQRYGVDPGAPQAVVLDPNLRVLGAVSLVATDPAAGVRALVDSMPPAPPDVEVVGHAPVLLVPDVLDPAWCARLMAAWEAGNEATGVETTRDGGRGEVLTGHKRRRDHVVGDAELMRALVGTVGRRVMPELQKAFAYRATRFEGFKIACYDAATGGFFRPHRDNLSPATAHRRFALTLNLNDPREYSGGGLRFPEYGPQRYRPRAGEALLFSCSHLHEVLDVTAGRRWVLLSFLSGDDGARPTAA